jgi:hypothetical protein
MKVHRLKHPMLEASSNSARLVVDPVVELPEGATVTVLIDDRATRCRLPQGNFSDKSGGSKTGEIENEDRYTLIGG